MGERSIRLDRAGLSTNIKFMGKTMSMEGKLGNIDKGLTAESVLPVHLRHQGR